MLAAFDSNIKHVALSYIRLLKIKVSASSFCRELEENPYYPTLFSLSEAFEKFHIANSAYKVAPEDLGDVEPPFIALTAMAGSGEDFVLITDISDDSVGYIYKGKRRGYVRRDRFNERFKGIVFSAEPDSHSGEENFDQHYSAERAKRKKRDLLLATMGVVIGLMVAGHWTTVAFLPFFILLLIKSAGLFLTISLLVYDIDQSKGVVSKVCSPDGRFQCNAVLNSKGATVLGIRWSEIGFFYFAATTLILLFTGTDAAFRTGLLAVFNACTIPYVGYSLFYQGRVLQQWCPACVAVEVTLFSELIWSVIYFWLPVHSLRFPGSAGVGTYLEIGSLLLLPIVVWNFLKPHLIGGREGDLFRSKYKRLLKNPDLFHSLLMQQAGSADDWQNLGITIGNPVAANTVIKVCSPFCPHCADAHLELDRLIRRNDHVNLKLIFLVPDGQQGLAALVTRHLLAIAAVSTMPTIIQALDDWYLSPVKNYAAFAARYPLNGELRKQDDQLATMKAWCDRLEIRYTPTILVNGRLLPDEYSIEDLTCLFEKEHALL